MADFCVCIRENQISPQWIGWRICSWCFLSLKIFQKMETNGENKIKRKMADWHVLCLFSFPFGTLHLLMKFSQTACLDENPCESLIDWIFIKNETRTKGLITGQWKRNYSQIYQNHCGSRQNVPFYWSRDNAKAWIQLKDNILISGNWNHCKAQNKYAAVVAILMIYNDIHNGPIDQII